MENAALDFEKIAFKSVKRHTVKEHAPDLVALIMSDYASAEGNFHAFYSSFEAIADSSGLTTATAIFDDFLSDSAIEEYVKIWVNKENFARRFGEYLDSH